MGWIADLLKEIPSAARYKAELETMEKESAVLKLENADLKAQISDLRQELQRRADVNEEKKSHDQHLPEVRDKLLVLLASSKQYASEVAATLGLNEQLVLHHFEQLVLHHFEQLVLHHFEQLVLHHFEELEKSRHG